MFYYFDCGPGCYLGLMVDWVGGLDLDCVWIWLLIKVRIGFGIIRAQGPFLYFLNF